MDHARRGVLWIGLGALLAAGCAVAEGHPYGADEESVVAAPPKHHVDPPAPEQPTSTDPTTSSASETESTVLNGPCAPQDVPWISGQFSCTAKLTQTLQDGASTTLTDSTLDETGKATVTCQGGKLVVSNGTCEMPVKLDLMNPPGCGSGYCEAAISGSCGAADTKKATAVCVAHGYTAFTAYTMANGPNGARQCAADGTSCFTNQNPQCNTIFSSVTCQH
jgi:hypothetical protein